MWRPSQLGIVALIFGLALTGCATGVSNSDDDTSGTPDAGPAQPDGLITPLPDAAVSQPDANTQPQPDASGAGASVTLSHSNSLTVSEANTIACAQETTNYTSENSYYRTFELASFGVNGPLEVTSVDIGIESAVATLGGQQPATLYLHTLSGTPSTGNLTEIASIPVTVADQTLSVLNVTTSATVPAGATLVVEFRVPDGTVDGNSLFVGSNTDGETGPTYIRAPDCAVDDMITMAEIAYPDVAWVLSVNGTKMP